MSAGDPVPMDPVPLDETMNGLLRRLRMDNASQVGGIFTHWDDVVGEDLARNIQPVKLEDGVLLVEASDAAWVTQFRFLENNVKARLSERIGASIVRIEVRQKRR